MKKAILVGAGPIDESCLQIDEGSYLVAADGGYRSLIKAGLEADLFVGDFDTLKKEEIKNPKRKIILNTHKDDTDIFYAVKLLLKEGYDEFHLYGCLGGKIEHTIANIQVLSYITEKGKKAFLYSKDGKTVVHMIKNSCIRFNPLKQGNLSVFSYNGPCHKVTEKNLLYTIDAVDLSESIPLGVSNQFIGKEAYISVEKGTLLLVLPKEGIRNA